MTPADAAAAGQFPRQPARLLVAVDLPRAVRRSACSPSSSPTTGRCSSRYDGQFLFPGPRRLSRDDLRRRFCRPRPTTATPTSPALIDAKGWMIWPLDPLQLRHHQLRLCRRRRRRRRRAATGSAPTIRPATCWRGSSTASASRCCSASSLTIARARSIGVAAGAVQGYFGGLDRPAVPALHRDLVGPAGALSAHHPVQHHRRRISGGCSASCCCSRWMSLVELVRAEFLRARNFDYVRAARALGVGNVGDHLRATCCPTPWWRR